MVCQMSIWASRSCGLRRVADKVDHHLLTACCVVLQVVHKAAFLSTHAVLPTTTAAVATVRMVFAARQAPKAMEAFAQPTVTAVLAAVCLGDVSAEPALLGKHLRMNAHHTPSVPACMCALCTHATCITSTCPCSCLQQRRQQQQR